MAENEVLSEKTESKSDRRRREEAERAGKRKKQTVIIGIVLAVCVVIGVVLSLVQGNLIYRSIGAVKVGDTQYSVAEYNWMYSNSFFEIYENLSNQYGSYVSTVLDTNKPLKDQQYSDDQTWAEHMLDYTDEALRNMTALYDDAKANGWEMDEFYKTQVDYEWNQIEAGAEQYNVDTTSYLVATYGKGVNEKVFRSMYEKYFYAYSYANSVQTGFEVTDADKKARYDADPKAYDRVSFRYYFSKSDPANTDTAAAMEEANAVAKAVYEAEDMDAYLESELSASMSELRYYPYASINTTYADWLFDDARKAGDRELFKAETGWYVIEYLEKPDLDYNMVSVRHCLIKPDDVNSEESWAKAESTAEDYFKTYADLGGGEDYFAYIAMAYSADTGSQSTGGLYSRIKKGQMVPEFEDWCFDPARKEGDIGTIRSSSGVHMMYFVSEDEPFLDFTLDSEIREGLYKDYAEKLTDSYSFTILDGRKYCENNR